MALRVQPHECKLHVGTKPLGSHLKAGVGHWKPLGSVSMLQRGTQMPSLSSSRACCIPGWQQGGQPAQRQWQELGLGPAPSPALAPRTAAPPQCSQAAQADQGLQAPEPADDEKPGWQDVQLSASSPEAVPAGQACGTAWEPAAVAAA